MTSMPRLTSIIGRFIIFAVPFLVGGGVHAQSVTDSVFDLRDYYGDGTTSYVTSVKSQNWGTCWTFATMAAMESNLAMTGTWTDVVGEGDTLTYEPNLAEYHLDKYSGFTRRGQPDDESANSWMSGQKNPYPGSNYDEPLESRDHGLIVHLGGDYQVSTAYATTNGAVMETATTNIPDFGSNFASGRIAFGYEDDNGIKRYDNYTYFMPGNVDYLTYTGTDEEKRERIKESLVNNGAVGTCVSWNSAYYTGYNFYQPPESTADINHAVTIIGWDDTHVTQAAEPGAWLVKNSWDTWWGQKGYFWVSYYDKNAAKHQTMGGVSYNDIHQVEYDTVYNHALHGWRYDTSTEETIDTIANRFVAGEKQLLESVGIYTLADDVTYTLEVVTGLGTDAEQVLYATNGVTAYPGFHEIGFDSGVLLREGEEFYVRLDLSDGGYAFDASFKMLTAMGTITSAPYDVYSTAAAGESFYYDEQTGLWSDFLDFDAYNLLGTAWNDDSWNFTMTAYASSIPGQMIEGDVNGDGCVDGSDVTVLAGNWQQNTSSLEMVDRWILGDLNYDGIVDGSDVTILAGNWQYGVSSTATAVPEPSGTVLLLTILLAVGLDFSLRKRIV